MTIRFLEERPGVWSMTRLLALMAAIGGALAMVTACVVAVLATSADAERMSHAAGVVAALAALSASAFGGSWAQTRERSKPDEPPPILQTTAPTQVTVTTEVGGQ